MRQPSEGIGDRCWVLLLRQESGEKAVETSGLDYVQRCGGDIVALLIARSDQSGPRVDGDEWLAQTAGEHFERAAVRRYSQDGPIVFAKRRALLAAFGEDERAIRRNTETIGEFPCLRRLREDVAE